MQTKMSEYRNTTSSSSPTLSFRSTPSPEHPEDQPLGGAGRTFAQLLVDQLGEAEDKNVSLTQHKKVNLNFKDESFSLWRHWFDQVQSSTWSYTTTKPEKEKSVTAKVKWCTK